MDERKVPSPATSNSRGVVAATIGWVYALLPANLIPTIIARLVDDFGFDLTNAGLLATGMTLANSLTVLAVRPWVKAGHRGNIGAAGVVILVGVAVLGMLIPTASTFTAVLLISGVGSGLVLAASSASISATSDPDRATAVAMVVNRLVVAVAYFSLPFIGVSMTATLLVLAVPGLVALVAMRWLPRVPAEAAEANSAEGLGDSGRKAGLLAWSLALAFGLWSVTDDGVIGMAELLGINHFGESGSELVLNLLGISMISGLIGAVLARLAEKLLGRVGAIGVALIVSLATKLTIIVTTDPLFFSVAFVLWGAAFGMSLPLIFGLSAVLKRDGSANVVVNGVYLLGVALGPTVATQLFDLGEAGLLFWGMAILGVVGATAILITAVVWQRGSALETAVPEPQSEGQR